MLEKIVQKNAIWYIGRRRKDGKKVAEKGG